jgi:hypothetical protein
MTNLNGIVKFQRYYRFYKNELTTLNNKILLLKNTLLDMIHNLEYLNKLNIYDGLKNNYNVIFNELGIISNELGKIPSNINFKTIRDNDLTINSISMLLINVDIQIIKELSHISTSNILSLLTLLLGEKWCNEFNFNDIELLNFLTKIVKCTNVWDSLYHKQKVEYINTPINRSIFKKDSIENFFNNNKKTYLITDEKLPQLLSNLTDFLIKDESKNERKNHHDIYNIEDMFLNYNSKIKLTENYLNDTFMDNNKGIIIHIKINDRYIVIQGIVDEDILNIFKNDNIILSKMTNIKKYIDSKILNIPLEFKNNFYKYLSIHNIIILSNELIGHKLIKSYNDYNKLKSIPINLLISDFLLCGKSNKIDILKIFLSNEQYFKLGYLLFDIMKSKDKQNISNDILLSLPLELRHNLDIGKNKLLYEEKLISKFDMSELSYEKRINLMNTNDYIKNKAINKLKSIKNNIQGDNKSQSWLDGLLKIPFGIYNENNIMNMKTQFIKKIKQVYADCENLYSFNDLNNFITKLDTNNDIYIEWNQYKKDRFDYLKNVEIKLDNAVYGHIEAKTQLKRLFAQWINGESKGEILGLHGPPGTGKTSLAKKGLSQCLADNNGKNRPFAFLPIGGSTNGSTLVGHNYTYVGSTWGRIVDILMVSGCMNPIIFIDELDKISNTENGREISSILTHLTDLTQNEHFEDKYFAGIPFDLSKALIIFSFNDITQIDPILKDRITIIETKPFTIEEKIHILQNYMLPEIFKEIGFNNNEIIFSFDILKYLINTFTCEAGVRKIKELITEIIRDINLSLCYENNNIIIPYNITQEFIENLFKNKHKVRIRHICLKPQVGIVNGLYATTVGTGGLTVIQVMKYPSEKHLELTITGQQGDVMKESVNYALRIAYSLLTDEEKKNINNEKLGLHIHTPEAATKKDGPSAGAAITLAIYSVLTNKKINNTVALTGEIDLQYKVTAIGGIYSKLNGAKTAGALLVLIPKENEDDLLILRNKGISPEDDNFKVEFIEHIDDVIKYTIV